MKTLNFIRNIVRLPFVLLIHLMFWAMGYVVLGKSAQETKGVLEDLPLWLPMENLENEKEEVCELCGGTGEVNYDVWDEDSHNYQHGVGTKKCLCQLEEDDEANDQDR
jgi:hypothetical protein